MTAYTQVPNYFFDHMADMDKCEQSIVLLIIRKTLGYKKEWDRISFSQFQEASSAKHPLTVQKGIEAALERGIIERRECKNSYEYRVCDPGENTSHNEVTNASENESKIASDSEAKKGSENEVIIDNTSENESISLQKMKTQKKKEITTNTFPNGKVQAPNGDAGDASLALVGKKKNKLAIKHKRPSVAYVHPVTGVSTEDIFEAWKTALDHAEPGAIISYGKEKKAAKQLASAGKRPQDVTTCFWKMKNNNKFYRANHLSLTAIAANMAAVLTNGQYTQPPVMDGRKTVFSQDFQGSEA